MADASVNYKTIAKKCSTTIGTVHNRIKKMKDEGVIERTVPKLDPVKLGFDICVLIDVQITGGHMEVVQREFARHENVCSIYDITGDFDTTFVAKFRNTQDLNTFVKKLASNRHVIRTSTKLVLNIVKEGLAPDI